MNDSYLPQARGFDDLVPWADPYIATLLHSLSRTAALEEELARSAPSGEHRVADRLKPHWPRR